MKVSTLLTAACLLINTVISAGNGDYDYPEYQDYASQHDDLYHNYAERQHAKVVDTGRGRAGPRWGTFLFTGAVSWWIGGKVHAGRVAKRLKTKHQKEQKQLYAQYYNDVYKLSEQNQLLAYRAEELMDLVRSTEAKAELEALQRDYDEFKQPDIDGDDRISRAEFNMYVKNYLSNYPGLAEKDYPKFDDFDHDGDGYVSFQEYSLQMGVVAAQAEREQLHGNADRQKSQALNDLYNSAKKGGSDFHDYYR